MLKCPADEKELNWLLSEPAPALIEMMKRLDGDIAILGVAGKMGVTMAMQAKRAVDAAGVKKKIIGVARFSNPEEKVKLEEAGVETIKCDLLDREQVNALPDFPNIVFMAGKKFGTQGNEAQTWAMNALAPAFAAEKFRNSRMVIFSTGCVYPLKSSVQGGCVESDMPSPIGEYSQSCLARERIFEYYQQMYGTKMLFFRLNYAIDLRYGVLHDICRPVWEGKEVSNSVGFFNCIWQGDANANALLSLELADNPRRILNVTGPETASTEKTALEMGRLLGKEVKFTCAEAGDLNYLNDASEMIKLFGKPRVSLEELIRLQAEWISQGGVSIGKPTHFEVNNGKF